MHPLSRRTVLAGLAAFPLLPQQAGAQEALKIIYPYPAGGSGDAVGRMIAEHLQKSLNRPIVVENKTGAGGRIGVQAVKDALPDGNTLLFTATGPMTFVPHLVTNPGYDPFADFVPISEVARSEIVLAVSSQIDVRTPAELVTWLKANSDRAVYATPGSGTSAHFTGAEFGRASGLTLRHAPYRGAPAALPDVLAGRVPMLIAIGAELLEHHRSGGIRILATAGTVRSPFLPDVPTLAEIGLDIEASNGFAFYAPSRTSPAFLAQLEREIMAAVQTPAIKTRVLSFGLQPTGTSAEELKRMQRSQYDRWGTAVKASGFKPE